MRFRLDSSLADDSGWTTPSARAQRVLIGTSQGALLREGDDRVLRSWDCPLAALDWLDRQRCEGGRWVGFFSYELGALLEPAVCRRPSDRGESMPLFAWGWTEPFKPRRIERAPAGIRGRAVQPIAALARDTMISSFTRDSYLRAVQRCIDYIAAGDVFQVNLSHRLSLPFHAPDARGPRESGGPRRFSGEERRGLTHLLYDILLDGSPARYGALLELDDLAILSNSPELFLRITRQGRIITRPIKGTRPRTTGMAHELLASAKDAAELNMIVDLERNDLGRVCEIGTVRVTEPRIIEEHPSVYHGAATVEGRLRQSVGLVELLRATFPGGSVTGAPKIRAMQIIDELEPGPRGVYCGAIGHLDSDGSLQLNLAIRTMTLDHTTGVLHIPVGGGIVADSDPAEEYEETWVKARAMLEAASAMNTGVRPHPR